MCQIIPIWMRPHVAEHLTQGLGMLTIEPELSVAFSERDNGHITLVSNAVWPCSCRRAAVCPAHGDAGDIFASEGARRPFPAPDGRGRQPPRRLQLLCAAARIEVDACAFPHVCTARRGCLPGRLHCASPRQSPPSGAASRPVHSRLTRPVRHPCAGFSCPRAADLPSGSAHCLARCKRAPVAPQEAPRRRRASLGRPGGGHRSRRGQPRRRRRVCRTAVDVRACSERIRAISKKSGVSDVTKCGSSLVLSTNHLAS